MTKPHYKLTADGLVNLVSGLGTNASKRVHNQFVRTDTAHGYQQLTAAYQSNWIARAVVDIPADDMTREWRTLKCVDADAIRQEEDRLNVQAAVNEALSWARLFGGGAILVITNQDLSQPLQPQLIGKGDVKRLMVFDRWDLQPQQMNTWDILADNYLMPEFYTIYQGTQTIHHSHFIKFTGAKLPRRERIMLQGWGDSYLRKSFDDIKDIVASKDGIAELMQMANVDVITREGLAEDLATDQEDKIMKRYQLFDSMKSIINTALLDGEEKLDRLTLNLSGVAPVLETMMTWISGAAEIPSTRLFGRSPAGLNSTGDSDLQNYYNSIRSQQNSQLTKALQPLDEIIVRSALGTMPDDFNYAWNALSQPTDKEQAETRKLDADTDIAYLDNGVIGRAQIMRKLEAKETYQYQDGEIENIEQSENLSLGGIGVPDDFKI